MESLKRLFFSLLCLAGWVIIAVAGYTSFALNQDGNAAFMFYCLAGFIALAGVALSFVQTRSLLSWLLSRLASRDRPANPDDTRTFRWFDVLDYAFLAGGALVVTGLLLGALTHDLPRFAFVVLMALTLTAIVLCLRTTVLKIVTCGGILFYLFAQGAPWSALTALPVHGVSALTGAGDSAGSVVWAAIPYILLFGALFWFNAHGAASRAADHVEHDYHYDPHLSPWMGLIDNSRHHRDEALFADVFKGRMSFFIAIAVGLISLYLIGRYFFVALALLLIVLAEIVAAVGLRPRSIAWAWMMQQKTVVAFAAAGLLAVAWLLSVPSDMAPDVEMSPAATVQSGQGIDIELDDDGTCQGTCSVKEERNQAMTTSRSARRGAS